MPQERRVRERPRISAPKLGEYLYAEAGRRERLLVDQKFRPIFKVARYAHAENSIRAALVGGGDIETRLTESAQAVGALVTTTEWTAVGKRCCVQAIREFGRILPQLPTDTEFRLPGRSGITLGVEGVAVSVYPLVLTRRVVRGQPRQGAVLAVFQKNDPLGERAGKAVAEILRRALQQMGLADLYPAECIVADIFRGQIFAAKSQNHRLFANIASACREIAVRWPTLQPAMAA